MINAIFASEFDLQKGCLIKSNYPENVLFDDNLLASYMIPDGVHKIDQDYYFFKMKTIIPEEHWMIFNQAKIQTFKYNKNYGQWDSHFESSQQTLQYANNQFIINHQDQNLVLKFNSQIKVVSSDFVTFNHEFGILFEDKTLPLETLTSNLKQYYFCMIQNKKDKNIKRGSLIRSIAITSSQLHFFLPYQNTLKKYLDKYFETIGIEHWSNEKKNDENISKLYSLLSQAYKEMNYIQIDKGLYRFPLDIVLYNYYLKQNYSYLYDNNNAQHSFSKQPSLINLIQLFGNKTLNIMRAMLQKKRILFLTHDSSVQQTNKPLYSGTCDLICSCQELIKPLNYYEYTLGYQTITDLDWLNDKTFLAVVSNPIFITKYEWWDICCDIYTGNVEVQHQEKGFTNDQEFIENMVSLVQQQQIDEKQCRKMFLEYVKQYVEQDVIFDELEKYIRIKGNQLFGFYKCNQIIKCINIITNLKMIDDIDFLIFYQTIICSIDSDKKLKYFIKYFLFVRCSIEQLFMGLFCKNEQVQQKCYEALNQIEQFQVGKVIFKKANIYCLYVLQNKQR